MNTTIIHDIVTARFELDKLYCNAKKSAARETTPTQSSPAPTEVLVPMDFSDCSLNALQTAVRFAQKHGARITLLYVLDLNLCPTYRADTARIERELTQKAEENFAQLTQSLSAVTRFATKIVKGRPLEQILAVAREGGVKLIVMGKRRTKFWRFLHRRTALRVMEKAACDVIAVMEQNMKTRQVARF